MKVSEAYISLGANRSSSCSACTSTGILAFGAGPFVALWDTQVTIYPLRFSSPLMKKGSERSGVYATLKGHHGQVTALKLVDEQGGKAKLISGDSEGRVIIWEQRDSQKV